MSLIKLLLNDSSIFNIDEKYIKQIRPLNDMFDDLGNIDKTTEIPLINEDLTLESMNLIVQYLEHYPNEPEDVKYYVLDEWSTEFFKDMTYQQIETLMKGANYLAVVGLVERCAVKIAGLMAGKTIDQLRDVFNRELSPEFIEELKSENWNFA